MESYSYTYCLTDNSYKDRRTNYDYEHDYVIDSQFLVQRGMNAWDALYMRLTSLFCDLKFPSQKQNNNFAIISKTLLISKMKVKLIQ